MVGSFSVKMLRQSLLGHARFSNVVQILFSINLELAMNLFIFYYYFFVIAIVDFDFCRGDLADKSRLHSCPRDLALVHLDKLLVARGLLRWWGR